MRNSEFLAIRSVSGWATTLALMVLMLFWISTVTYQKGLVTLSEEGTIRLELFVTYLRGVLTKYESLPELLARDKRLVNFLLNPGGRDRIEALNKYLQTINEISNTADTYLMDRDGLTIAASNWQEELPFVGRNFSYRPYFQQAMKGQLGRYFALGTTSIKRGYYFAYPVRREREILGAVVIKINIDSVEKKWGFHAETFLVTDPDNVIFITTYPLWRFKTLGELDATAIDLIKKSRRYPISELDALPISTVKDYSFGQVINMMGQDGKARTYLQQSQPMEEAGWNVRILTDIRPLRRKIIEVNILVGTGILFSYSLLALWRQRQRRLAEMKRLEDQSRRALQELNEKLEMRVNERTVELVETNEQLLKEIQDRKDTEAVLKRTRSELIHAAKMATLGQMSAGINHELNQPLAAIRSYADNAGQLLGKERFVEAAWNMAQIGELTDRMAQLGVQLKEFSRKSSGDLETVPLHGVLDGALEILFPAIRKHDVTLHVDLSPENIELLANQVLLQQVMVNLLGNAIHAIEGRNKRDIDIQAFEADERVVIKVKDSGPGIGAEHLERIFDPFVTTKPSGQGLGLGLTISERILKEMGGDIRVETSPEGAIFIITLHRATGRNENK
ncbi:MAG: sensor histidine kinase [Desulfobacterales bacterium]|nr:sensor histidine kinase [Desulfobacterales bacterium]